MATKIDAQPEWHTAYNPDVLLNLVRPPIAWPAVPEAISPAESRRFLLFACACARMVWDLLPTNTHSAVQVRERFAEGRATVTDLRAAALNRRPRLPTAAHRHAFDSACALGFHWLGQSHPIEPYTDGPAREAARCAAKALACRVAGPVPACGPAEIEWHTLWNRVFSEAREHQAELVRDIFPPPGYAPPPLPDWRTDTVLALARQMDETGDFSAVPILADALQDAGCSDELMLSRCRAPSGLHSRGNWVVDLVLGRT